MAKKNNKRSSATKNLATSYFTVKKRRRQGVCLSEKQGTMKIEGVRMKRSRWVAEIKHPRKKNVRMWIGSYATEEEASRAYQMRKRELEGIEYEGAVEKDRFVGDEGVEGLCGDRDVAVEGIGGGGVCGEMVMEGVGKKGALQYKKDGIEMKMEHEELKSGAIAGDREVVEDQEVVSAPVESGDTDVVVKLIDFDDQVTKLDGFNDANIVDDLKESNGETNQSEDCDVTTNVIGYDEDRAMEVVQIDYQAERSLIRRIVEQETGDMLLRLGPVLIDRYGCLLGEFSWMDDLSIVKVTV